MRPYLMPVVYITERCNLRCSYCYVNKKGRTMDWDTARRTVDFLGALPYERRVFSFFGGEPLLAWGLVKRLSAYIARTGLFTDIFLCTNGTLLDGGKLEYFAAHGVTPQISIDGLQAAHDAHRRTPGNRGSFAALDRNLRLLGREYMGRMKHLHLRFTITPRSIPDIHETVKYLLAINLGKAQINFMPEAHSRYSPRDLELLDVEFLKLAKLCAAPEGRGLDLHYNECVVEGGRLGDAAEPGFRPFCRLAGQQLSVDLDGKVYACYIGARIKGAEKRRALQLGNIRDGMSYPAKLAGFDLASGVNPCQSCLAWNYERNGELAAPLAIYRNMFASWRRASLLLAALRRRKRAVPPRARRAGAGHTGVADED